MKDDKAPAPHSLEALIVARLDVLAAMVRRKGRRLLRHETEEDLVQGIVVSALRSARGFKYRGETQLLGWLRTIAERYLRDRNEHWSARKRGTALSVPITTGDSSTSARGRGVHPRAPSPGPATGASQKDELDAAMRAIGTLAPRDRELLTWVRDGLEVEDIARRLGVSADAARKAKQRAIERFRAAFRRLRGQTGR